MPFIPQSELLNTKLHFDLPVSPSKATVAVHVFLVVTHWMMKEGQPAQGNAGRSVKHSL